MPEFKVPTTPFRFWCQKVLPLVYDDSLSYYELLCKVIEYLNNTMSDVITLEDFVTNYFNNLDVQQEINNKLDEMAIDGTLTNLIAVYLDPKIDELEEMLNEYQSELNGEFSDYKTEMNSSFNTLSSTVLSAVDTQDGQIAVLEGRMDEFTALEEGSTTGDAELADIRVDFNGITYSTAGDAVREQAKEVFNLLSTDEMMLNYQLVLPCVDGNLTAAGDVAQYKKRGKVLYVDGTPISSNSRFRIHGQFEYAGNAPSPANHPTWYGTQTKFIVGHKYHIEVHKLSGDITLNDIEEENYVDMRDSNSNSVFPPFSGQDWTCTFVPEMVALVLRRYTYDDVYYYLEITDLTEKVDVVVDLTPVSDRLDADEEVLLHQIKIPCSEGSASSGNASASIAGTVLTIDGTTNVSLARYCINDTLRYAATQPSYANHADWYTDPMSQFTIGHKYQFKLHLFSGTYSLEENAALPYFDVRDSDGNRALLTQDNYIFTCNFLPEMICVGLGNGTYTNAKFFIEITDITQSIEDSPLRDYVVDEYAVPDYYTEALDSATSDINSYINADKAANYGTDIEAFVFITDVHWNNNAKSSPALINNIIQNCALQTVICGGDIIYSHNNSKKGAVTEVRSFLDKMTNIPLIEYYGVYGNHDSNANGNTDLSIQFTGDEEFNLYYSMFAYKDNVHFAFEDIDNYGGPYVKNDYYVDHPRTKTRYLCLDWKNPVNDTRVQWIQSVLARNDGYRVIVIYHGIYSHADAGTQTLEHYQIMPVLEPYKGKIVALFTGHTHNDYIGDYYGDGSVPVIVTGADMLTGGRTAGNANEQCFDVAIVNYNTKKINLVRIGAGSDREVSFTLSSNS